MQRLSFYLATIRMVVVSGEGDTGYITEMRMLHQKKLKLYRGIDNVFELEVRNAQSQRTDIMNTDITVHFFDINRKLLFSAYAEPVSSKRGVATVLVPGYQLDVLAPQQLTYAASVARANMPATVLYSDSQFGVHGLAEIYRGYESYENDGDVIDSTKLFWYDRGTKQWVSEIMDFGTTINNDFSSDITDKQSTIEIIADESDPFVGSVSVEVSNEISQASGSTWKFLDPIVMSVSNQKYYTGNWRYVRIRHDRYLDPVRQTPAGRVQEAIVRN